MKHGARRNVGDLYVVLGVDRGASQDEIKKAYRRLAARFHPDMPTGDEAMFKEVASAYEVLSDPERRAQYDRTGDSEPQEQFRMRPRGERPAASTAPWAKRWAERQEQKQAERQQARSSGPPAWQTDPRGGDRVNETAGFSDKNFCLRSIHEKALQGGGPLLLTTFWTFDGAFGRGALTAYSSEGGLGHGGMVAESWVGAEHATKAVFATFAGVPQKALLVRLLGADVADVTDGLWIDFCGDVPWSDPAFTKSAVTLVTLAEDKLGVVQTERPRRVRGAFYCAECQRQIPLEGGALPARCDFCDADLTRFTGLPSSVVGLEAPFEKAWARKRNRPRR